MKIERSEAEKVTAVAPLSPRSLRSRIAILYATCSAATFAAAVYYTGLMTFTYPRPHPLRWPLAMLQLH